MCISINQIFTLSFLCVLLLPIHSFFPSFFFPSIHPLLHLHSDHLQSTSQISELRLRPSEPGMVVPDLALSIKITMWYLLLLQSCRCCYFNYFNFCYMWRVLSQVMRHLCALAA